ncbi:MAG TPA: hypothetical protein VGP87_04465 [Gemmatimonadales bacterium]|nr:hypothetical protein [Gemmatimonadales bacterium]
MNAGLTERALTAAARPLLRRMRWLGGITALAGLLLVLVAAAWSARAGLVHSPIWVPAAWSIGFLAAGACVILALRSARALGSRRLAGRLEQDAGWRSGALRGLLEPAGEGTSDGLRAVADEATALEVEARAPEALRQERTRVVRLLAGAIAGVVGCVMLLGAAGVRHGPAALLWRPGLAIAMVSSPLGLEVDRRAVRAGDSVTLRVSAPGRRAVTLWTRSPGTVWVPATLALDSAGTARRVAGPLTEALFVHVTEGRRSSDTLEITVRRPAFLAAFAVTIRYPAYLKLEDEPAPVGGDTLMLPAGSRLEASGEASVPLGHAAWDLGGERAALAISGAHFGGTFEPAVSGGYHLVLRSTDGEPLSGDEIVVPVKLLPDLAPVVEIPVPAGDTTAPAVGSLPLVIDARDDHGLIDAVLERRVSHGGVTRTLAEERLPLPGQTPDRAILPAAIDPNALGLAPGDTLRVVARVKDNSPSGQSGRSREIAISVPTRPQLRAEGQDRARDIQKKLDSLVAESRSAQRQTEDLGRSQQRGTESALDFDAAKKAEAVADRQEQLIQQAEEAQKALDELRQAAERAGVSDSAFLQQLKEVQEQLSQALSPELRRQLAELQEALKSLDRERTKDAVRKLGDGQQKLREALERSREMFKRAALEGQLATLEQETKEIAEQQDKWNQQVDAADSANAAAEERAMAKRADSVAAGMDQAAKQLEAEQRKEAMKQAAQQARDAAGEMRQAAGAAEKKQTGPAQKSGKQASGKMKAAREQVKEQREGQQQEWRQEVVAQLDRALLETTRLADRQLAVVDQFRQGSAQEAARNAQGTIEEGVAKLLEQVGSATGKNALVSPQILAALAEARQDMGRAREAAASASGNLRESVDRAGDAVDALNVAAYGLLRSRDDVSGSGSGSGFAEAMERMTKLANQQGQLSQDANGLLPMAGASGIQQQLQALAARQRALAQELERLRAQGQADAKPLGDEARDLARALERGRLDRETVARQERLFRHMLDAGRTLSGREEDERKERKSETAKPGEIHLPPALSAKLLGKDGEIRLPTWEQLQRLSPEERRLVTDYFRRLTGGVP